MAVTHSLAWEWPGEGGPQDGRRTPAGQLSYERRPLSPVLCQPSGQLEGGLLGQAQAEEQAGRPCPGCGRLRPLLPCPWSHGCGPH